MPFMIIPCFYVYEKRNAARRPCCYARALGWDKGGQTHELQAFEYVYTRTICMKMIFLACLAGRELN